jgi:hypothetical protein
VNHVLVIKVWVALVMPVDKIVVDTRNILTLHGV